MIKLTLSIKNMTELEAVYKAAPAKALNEYDRAMAIGVKDIVSQAIKTAPVGKYHGGSLRQSIGSKRIAPANYIVFARAKYAGWVDQGTDPHIITVVNKKVLASKTQIFGRIVKHPGTRAQPFFTNAIKDNEAGLNTLLREAMHNVLSIK